MLYLSMIQFSAATTTKITWPRLDGPGTTEHIEELTVVGCVGEDELYAATNTIIAVLSGGSSGIRRAAEQQQLRVARRQFWAPWSIRELQKE